MHTLQRSMAARALLASMVAAFLFVATVGQASAFHCYVANKPNGAGAVTEDDIKEAGKSGKSVAPGAFFSLESVGLSLPDVFIRGMPQDEEPEEPEIVGEGSLPPQPHERGGPNGVRVLGGP